MCILTYPSVAVIGGVIVDEETCNLQIYVTGYNTK